MLPTTGEILTRQLDVIELIKRAVSGSKLKPAEAVDCLDFLNGLSAALPVHTHMCYTIYECAREITAKAAAAKPLDLKSNV